MKRTKYSKEQIQPMLDLLDGIAKKQRENSYKAKYYKQKKILDSIKPILGIYD